jgi:predicted transcriptional regulator/CRISPR/Cas system-associated endoribonuclease Cas2
MEKETKEIIKLTSKEILLRFLDVFEIFDKGFSKSFQKRIEIDDYFQERELDKANFSKKIRYLRKAGLIRKFYESKEAYIELTEKGIERLESLTMIELNINRPDTWDKKWRIVMFDIPEKEKNLRNIIRGKLYRLGFRQVQKSVFVYPFECTKEINMICEYYGGRGYLKYLIAEIFEGEDSIIKEFMDNKILSKHDITPQHNKK